MEGSCKCKLKICGFLGTVEINSRDSRLVPFILFHSLSPAVTRNLFQRTTSITRGIYAISDHSSGRSMLLSRMQSTAKKRKDRGKLVSLQFLASFTPLPAFLPLQRAGVREVVEVCEEARLACG